MYVMLTDFLLERFGLWTPLVAFLGIPIAFALILSFLGGIKRKIWKKKEEGARRNHAGTRKTFDPTPYKTAGITIGLFTEIAFGLFYIPTVSYVMVKAVHGYGFPGYWDTVTYWTAQMLLLVWVYPGLREIRPAWRGSLTLLGRRIPNIQIAEGANWLPWLLWGAIPVNMKEMSLEIGKSEERHEEEGVILTENLVRVEFDMSITYRVFDPYAFLGIGIEMVDNGVHDLSLSQVRDKIVGTSDTDAYKLTEELRQEILYAIDERSDSWGIYVTKVIIKYIRPFSETIASAYEKFRVEEEEAKGEQWEVDFNIASQKRYRDEVGLTPEGAAAVHAGERGKDVRVSVNRILVNDEGLNTAAAIVASSKDGGE